MLPSTRIHVTRGLFHLTPTSAAVYAMAVCVQQWELATMHTNRQRVHRRSAGACYVDFSQPYNTSKSYAATTMLAH